MSDYTPPAVVTPTPGGAAGDASVDGAMTVQSGTAGGMLLGASSAAPSIELQANNGGPLYFKNSGGNVIDVQLAKLHLQSLITLYNTIATAGLGVAPIYGLDNRTALMAADASAITLYTTTATGEAYHLLAHIFARGGITPTGTYVVKFTEGGVAISKTMSVSAVDTDSDISIPCQPDNAATITAQLTLIGGTAPIMDVYCSVKEEA